MSRPLENPKVTFAAVVDKYLVANRGADLFTMFRSSIGMMSSILELAPDTIINLHWISGAVSTDQIKMIAARFERVFWTLHDYRPLTGGCHFPGDCKGYLTGCSACPMARSIFWPQIEKGAASISEYFKPVNLTLVCPSEGLRLAAAESALGLHARVVKIPNVSSVASAPRELRNSGENLKVRLPSVFLFAAADVREKRKGLVGVISWWTAEARTPDAQLWIAGEGSEGFADSSKNIISFGTLTKSKLEEKMSEASYFVFASDADNAPGVIQEAIASEMVVICMNTKMQAWLQLDGIFSIPPEEVEWELLESLYSSSAGAAIQSNSKFLDDSRPESVAKAYQLLYQKKPLST
jgi:hypothetical protein